MRRASAGAAVVAAEEQRQREMQAKFDALPDDVKREQLNKIREKKIERLKAERGRDIKRELLDQLLAEEDRGAATIVGVEGVRRSYVEAVVAAVEARGATDDDNSTSTLDLSAGILKNSRE